MKFQNIQISLNQFFFSGRKPIKEFFLYTSHLEINQKCIKLQINNFTIVVPKDLKVD